MNERGQQEVEREVGGSFDDSSQMVRREIRGGQSRVRRETGGCMATWRGGVTSWIEFEVNTGRRRGNSGEPGEYGRSGVELEWTGGVSVDGKSDSGKWGRHAGRRNGVA